LEVGRSEIPQISSRSTYPAIMSVSLRASLCLRALLTVI